MVVPGGKELVSKKPPNSRFRSHIPAFVACGGVVLPQAMQSLFRNSLAVIADLKMNLLRVQLQNDANSRGARVPVNIREAFLQDAEQSCFHFSIQSCHVRWNFQIDLNPAALGKSFFTVPASGGSQPAFSSGG